MVFSNWLGRWSTTAAAAFLIAASTFALAQVRTVQQSAEVAAISVGVTRIQTVEGITEYRLANGLKVLLAPDLSDDRVSVNLTYLVGSRHEGYGETGMAHLLEHLMFKGSPGTADPKAEFRKRGFTFNGTTNSDRTNYFATFVSSQEALDWYLGWQADAMLNSFIAKKDLDSEMTVVRSEFELVENNPFQALAQRMARSAYLWHAYGKATIGAGLEQQTVGSQLGVDDLQNLGAQVVFFEQVSEPQNADPVRNALGATDAYEVTVETGLEQGLLSPEIRQAKPLLQAVNAQHHCQFERRAARLSHRCMRCNQRQQFTPRHHSLHLLEQDLFARAPGAQIKAKVGLFYAVVDCNLRASVTMLGGIVLNIIPNGIH